MAYTLERINAEIVGVCKKAGFDDIIHIPVSLNSRLTSTLGRVRCINGRPVSIEFSAKFIKNAKDNDIHEVILHECAHVIANVRDRKEHGHDNYFKQICAELGTDNDKCFYKSEKELTNTEPVYKYKVYCKDCGELIASYKRKGKTIKNLEFYRCSLCGGKLIVK